MPVLPVASLRERANDDPEFRIAARFWSCALRLEAGDTVHSIRIEDGRIAEIISDEHARGEEPPGWVRIAAAPDAWRRFLEPLPRPFYQDLWGAATHHGFELGGDLLSLCAYYPAIRRLFDLMRSEAE